MKSNNWICRLFGCRYDNELCGCYRCGLQLYDMDCGVFWPVLNWFRNTKGRVVEFWTNIRPWNYCDCGKIIAKDKYFCSEECENNYIPF